MCSYCEWCFTHKIRKFPIEKIKAEIEWIASKKIRYCYCADANFGILERDVEIAKYVVEQKNYGKLYLLFSLKQKPCYSPNNQVISAIQE